MPEQTELQKKLDVLGAQIDRGKLMESLSIHQGWIVLKNDIEKRLEAYKREAMTDKYINDHNGYLSIIGAHNALKSLLDIIELHSNLGIQAAKELGKIENESKEEIDRLGIQTRI